MLTPTPFCYTSTLEKVGLAWRDNKHDDSADDSNNNTSSSNNSNDNSIKYDLFIEKNHSILKFHYLFECFNIYSFTIAMAHSKFWLSEKEPEVSLYMRYIPYTL